MSSLSSLPRGPGPLFVCPCVRQAGVAREERTWFGRDPWGKNEGTGSGEREKERENTASTPVADIILGSSSRWSIISSGVLAYMKYWCYREPTLSLSLSRSLRSVPRHPLALVSLDFTRIREHPLVQSLFLCLPLSILLLVPTLHSPSPFPETLCRRFLRLLSPFALALSVVIRFFLVLPPFFGTPRPKGLNFLALIRARFARITPCPRICTCVRILWVCEAQPDV